MTTECVLPEISAARGLPLAESEMLRDLVAVWRSKLSRNVLRRRYYECHNRLKDLGISIPPSLRNVETAVGWPAKAVDSLAARSRFDGFAAGDRDTLSMVRKIADDNMVDMLYRGAVNGELVNSVAFFSVSMGGPGEPDVVISTYGAEEASAIWDRRRKRLRCGMAIVDVEERPSLGTCEPSAVCLYTDDAVWEVQKYGGRWIAWKNEHAMGRPTLEAMAHTPVYPGRPFGRSRISRAVMSITDSAVREALRSEISAEFFTSPQKYLLGADDGIFESKTKWDAYIGSIFAIGVNEDGDVPQFGQLQQSSMQPHVDYMRALAARFSGETDVPVSELGVIHDNPSSAEAIYAAKEALVCRAQDLNAGNARALENVARMSLAAVLDVPLAGVGELVGDVAAVFRSPAMPSAASQADSAVKIASVAPWYAETDEFLEDLGYDERRRRSMQSQRRRSEAMGALALIAGDGDGAAE